MSRAPSSTPCRETPVQTVCAPPPPSVDPRAPHRADPPMSFPSMAQMHAPQCAVFGGGRAAGGHCAASSARCSASGPSAPSIAKATGCAVAVVSVLTIAPVVSEGLRASRPRVRGKRALCSGGADRTLELRARRGARARAVLTLPAPRIFLGTWGSAQTKIRMRSTTGSGNYMPEVRKGGRPRIRAGVSIAALKCRRKPGARSALDQSPWHRKAPTAAAIPNPNPRALRVRLQKSRQCCGRAPPSDVTHTQVRPSLDPRTKPSDPTLTLTVKPCL